MYLVSISVIRGCWITFLVVWLLAAAITKRSVYSESHLRRLRYAIILVAGCMLLFKAQRVGWPLKVRLIPRSDVIAAISAFSCVGGLIFCLWARAVLGRNWSGNITVKEGHELITRGPYRLSRHPIYTGLLAMCLGTMAIPGNLGALIGTVLIFVSFWIKLRDEEAIMLRQFPLEYPAYRQRVKTIIPFVL